MTRDLQGTWDRRFFELAKTVGAWSKDRSRQVGAVVVDRDRCVRSIGYNGFPRGVRDEDDARHQRPAKYLWTEHAERNAIYNAARIGVSLHGCSLYVPWFPCADCARAIVQSGIAELVAIVPDLNDPTWKDHFGVAAELLAEGGVVMRFVTDQTLEGI